MYFTTPRHAHQTMLPTTILLSQSWGNCCSSHHIYLTGRISNLPALGGRRLEEKGRNPISTPSLGPRCGLFTFLHSGATSCPIMANHRGRWLNGCSYYYASDDPDAGSSIGPVCFDVLACLTPMLGAFNWPSLIHANCSWPGRVAESTVY